MVPETSWAQLSYAVSHFSGQGYTYTNVPWTAPLDILKATCPENRWIVGSSIGGLVGSAEQSFMSLDHAGQLGKGQFIACTPCFRNEDHVDDLHLKTFMKAELYINDDVSEARLTALLVEMETFFGSFLTPEELSHLKCVHFPDGTIDIELMGIEIGSYGIRQFGSITWIYGTALAEPRFSTTIRKLRNVDRTT